MRQQLDIFANVIKAKTWQGVKGRHADINIAIIRENTEGEYSGLEHQSVPGVIESLKVITRAKSERIVRFAFDWAIQHKRTKLTCVHKANIMYDLCIK
jgi:isocitrate dehydrogenase (NAD+)